MAELKRNTNTNEKLQEFEDITEDINLNKEEVPTEPEKSDVEESIDKELEKIDTETKELKENEEKEKSFNEKIYELDLKIEECEVKLDVLENKILVDPEDYDTQKEYLELKKIEKGYVKEKKQLQKQINQMDTSALNKVSIWIIIFGSLSVIISFPLITQFLWLDVAQFFIDLLTGAFAGLDTTSFLFYVIEFLLIFAFPLILNIITWLLFVNLVKTKLDKKVFSIFWIIQGVLSLGTIIYMCTILYK